MSHEPAPHGTTPGAPGPHDPIDDRISTQLSIAQFLVTIVVIGGVAALAYVAGLNSGGGHGKKPEAAAVARVDVSALMAPTPELIAKGKSAFAINCASCHGTAGKGDGPAAAALNPKPRNFTESYWRYGGGLARVVRTISEGSPGTAMSAFTGIPLEDRVAIAHYIRSLGPALQDDKPEDVAWLNPAPGAADSAGGATAAGGAPAPTGPVIPIADAMKSMVEAEPAAGVSLAAVEGEPGADVYAARCASCHGPSGEGGVRVRMLGSSPYAYVTTRSLAHPRGEWSSNPAAFERLVLEGLGGFVMPGSGDLSRAELRDLYTYTQKLRARQEAGRGSGS